MGLIRLAVVGAAGYYVYNKFMKATPHDSHPAFASGESRGGDLAKVRNAGPDAMRSDLPEWDKVDEAVDESFPASDPPALH